jgi:glycosyltransferase involved in cell wall biosynthesis
LVGVACIIPTHRRPAHLAASLKCVLQQTLPPTEIIVVDDLDDDQTGSLVDMLRRETTIPMRRLLNRQHPGASGSRNAGARAAQADIIAFLDDDDRWRPAYLSSAVSELAKSRADAVISGLRRFKVDGTTQDMVIPPQSEIADRIFDKNFGMTGSNLVIRPEPFGRLGGFDPELPVYEDWDFLIRFVQSDLRYTVVPETNAEWREHEGARLSALTLRHAEGIERFIAKHTAAMPATSRRNLQANALGIRRRVATSPLHRIWLAVKLVRLLGVRETVKRRLAPRILGARRVSIAQVKHRHSH